MIIPGALIVEVGRGARKHVVGEGREVRGKGDAVDMSREGRRGEGTAWSQHWVSGGFDWERGELDRWRG